MDQNQINEIIEKYKQGKATVGERKALLSWYRHTAYQDGVFPDEEARVKNRMFGRLNNELFQRRTFKLWPRIAAVASIIICLTVGGYVLLNKPVHQQYAQNKIHDIAPGGNKATLTLANGNAIVLTNAKNGVLANQGNAVIHKTADGNIVYDLENPAKNSINETQYNKISTPRGGQYNLVLTDGTRVWLNSASSLTYPTKFTGNERKVELTGEAYFEVSPNKHMPFRVVSYSQTVEVLGTHFNINAYDEEPFVKTTLLEGKVKVIEATHGSFKLLNPGQQSVLNNSNIQINDADTEAAIAWKNGDFIFKDEDLKATMRKIARWYDIDVVYDPSATLGLTPGGWISRSKNISAVLKIMELTGKVHFKIEGRRVIVIK